MAAGVVSLALRDPSSTRLETEAQRLSALLESARAESRAIGPGRCAGCRRATTSRRTSASCACPARSRSDADAHALARPTGSRRGGRRAGHAARARADDRRAAHRAAPGRPAAACWPPTAWGRSASSPKRQAAMKRGFTLVEVLVARGGGRHRAGRRAARRRRADRQLAAPGRRDRRAVVRRKPPHQPQADAAVPGHRRDRVRLRTARAALQRAARRWPARQYADLRLVDASVSDDTGRQLVRLSTLLYRP